MDRISLAAVHAIVAVCVATGVTACAPRASGESPPPSAPRVDRSHDWNDAREVPTMLVQRRARLRSPERHQLKELEDYYDDLEDFYKDRNPYLAEYYESIEKYYEDVRKGRRAFLPPEGLPDEPPIPGELGPIPPRIELRFGALPAQPRGNHPYAALERAYRDLRSQLARLNTAESWLRYLKLPMETGRETTTLDVLWTADSKEQFAEALRRFDSTAADREFRAIARLPAFGRTRNALRSFNRWLEAQPTYVDPAADVEEIPTPAPVETPTPADGPLLTPEP